MYEIYAKVLRTESLEKAKVDVEMKKSTLGWGLANSVVLATARGRKARILAGDEHFRDLPDVVFLK